MTETQNQELAPSKTALLVLAGLQAGRIVNYVMNNKRVRPLLITEAFDGAGTVNGILFFDAANDGRDNFPQPLAIDASGHEPLCCTPVSSVPYIEPVPNGIIVAGRECVELQSGTWHWPTKQPVRASSVDANVLETLFEQLAAKLRDELLGNQDQMIQTVNAKLQSTLEAVNLSLDSHSQMIAGFKSTVAGGTGETGSTGSGGVAATGETGEQHAPVGLSDPLGNGQTKAAESGS